MFASKIRNSKEWANIGEMAIIENFNKTSERLSKETVFNLRPEYNALNEVIEHHKNDSADQLFPALQLIREEIHNLADLVEKSETKHGKLLNDSVNYICQKTSEMLHAQDLNLQDWSTKLVAELHQKTEDDKYRIQTQLEQHLNKMDIKVETGTVMSKLIIKTTDKISISQAIIRTEQEEILKRFDENILNMQLFGPGQDTKTNPSPQDSETDETVWDDTKVTDDTKKVTFDVLDTEVPISTGQHQQSLHQQSLHQQRPHNSTLISDANPGRPKGNKRANRAKNPSNEASIPGTTKNAEIKNKLSSDAFTPEYRSPKRSLKISIVPDLEDPNEEIVQTEYQEYHDENDWKFQPTKSMKRRILRRKKQDKQRAQTEVIFHGIETTKYIDGTLFHINEATKAVEFLEEISIDYLGEDGLDIKLEHIVNAGRIDLWSGPDKFKPMVVKFIDSITANAVMKAMKIAGYFKQRTHVNRGKYKKTGDKKLNNENAKIILDMKDCYGRQSSTKAEREVYRKKKEYEKTPEFKAKSTFQVHRQERTVDFAKIKSGFNLVKKDGKINLIKKPVATGNTVKTKTAEDFLTKIATEEGILTENINKNNVVVDVTAEIADALGLGEFDATAKNTEAVELIPREVAENEDAEAVEEGDGEEDEKEGDGEEDEEEGDVEEDEEKEAEKDAENKAEKETEEKLMDQRENAKTIFEKIFRFGGMPDSDFEPAFENYLKDIFFAKNIDLLDNNNNEKIQNELSNDVKELNATGNSMDMSDDVILETVNDITSETEDDAETIDNINNENIDAHSGDEDDIDDNEKSTVDENLLDKTITSTPIEMKKSLKVVHSPHIAVTRSNTLLSASTTKTIIDNSCLPPKAVDPPSPPNNKPCA